MSRKKNEVKDNLAESIRLLHETEGKKTMDPDYYGKRRGPVVVQSNDDVLTIGKQAADTLRASIRKAAIDVLDAAAAVEGIAKFISEDAMAFAEYMEEQSQNLENRVSQFAEVGHGIAKTFRDSKEQVMAMNTFNVPQLPSLPPPPLIDSEVPVAMMMSSPPVPTSEVVEVGLLTTVAVARLLVAIPSVLS